jgi:hypothetical protein
MRPNAASALTTSVLLSAQIHDQHIPSQRSVPVAGRRTLRANSQPKGAIKSASPPAVGHDQAKRWASQIVSTQPTNKPTPPEKFRQTVS